ncbi:MAG TPA: hypothetical protein DCZ01_05940 [Elusimicrobia bacterium]|nr:MAG: hypothetical protein A2X37_06290 [Elusimicrobia bacterium GWA2_66_18]OGR69379.1 MAG: hypothetical protein A2X40_07240 [Elusimicrobia bacterium GWC2_65_9]HAZ08057.1 hypothetical protein [Elusimicrobiota bacterium]
MTTAALVLLLAVPAPASPALRPKDQRAELRAALEAHMDGDDAQARRHLAACVKIAPESDDASGCRIYLEWWAKGVKQGDKPSNPLSRRLYSLGAEAYKKGDRALAGAAWRECLGKSVVGTAVRNDCLAMIDLVPKTGVPADEAASRGVYMEGFLLYGKGDAARAREKWLLCLDAAPKGGPTWSDCQAGLEKLDASSKK